MLHNFLAAHRTARKIKLFVFYLAEKSSVIVPDPIFENVCSSINVCRIYIDIYCGQFSLPTWNSFIGQLVHPVGGKGIRWKVGMVSIY